MSLSSSLTAGVAGLQVNSTKLATVSDNIANSATPGYRRADVEFASLVNNEARRSLYSAGGVRAISYRDVSVSGTLTSTNNPTDLAVGGNGMLPVTDATKVEVPLNERPFLMTPTASFRTDEQGYLVSQTGLALLGFQTDEVGNLPDAVVRDGPSSLQPVRVSPFLTAAQATSQISLGVNLPARGTEFALTGPVPLESPIQYFDSVGREKTLRVVYSPTTAPTAGDPPTDAWNIAFFDSDGPDPTQPIASLDLQFDDTTGGTLTNPGGVTELDLSGTPGVPPGYNPASYDPLTGKLTVQASGGEVPIEVFVGTPLDPNLGGITQLDAEFAPTNVIKDGAPAGTLSSLEVDERGVLLGVYDTGQRVALFQIPIADVPNMNGLSALNNQTFALSPDSGNVFLHDANSGPVGTLESAALQESSVDIARELTDLIRTQRAYSSNATIIQTVDEMLQETTNLKR
ncbi:MAG: flagellar hook-basal body complex protein [Pseudomonadota bacterium]